MPQISGIIKKERAKILREAGDAEFLRLKDRMHGTTQNILIEANGLGRCENFLSLKVQNKSVGEVIRVVI